MKDSQLFSAACLTVFKYIKADNERFSTAGGRGAGGG